MDTSAAKAVSLPLIWEAAQADQIQYLSRTEGCKCHQGFFKTTGVLSQSKGTHLEGLQGIRRLFTPLERSEWEIFLQEPGDGFRPSPEAQGHPRAGQAPKIAARSAAQAAYTGRQYKVPVPNDGHTTLGKAGMWWPLPIKLGRKSQNTHPNFSNSRRQSRSHWRNKEKRSQPSSPRRGVLPLLKMNLAGILSLSG